MSDRAAFRLVLFCTIQGVAQLLPAQSPGAERPISSVTNFPMRLLATASANTGDAIAAWSYSKNSYSPPSEFRIGRFDSSGEPIDGDGVVLTDPPDVILPRAAGGFEVIARHQLDRDGYRSVVHTEVTETPALAPGATETLFDRGWYYEVDSATNGENLLVAAARGEGGGKVILARSFDAERNFLHEERVATVWRDIRSLHVVWSGEAWLVIWSDVDDCRITCVGTPFAVRATRLDRLGHRLDERDVTVLEGAAYFTAPRVATNDDRTIIAASSEKGAFLFEVARDGRIDRRPVELPVAAIYDLELDERALTILFAPYNLISFDDERRLASHDARNPFDPNTVLAASINVAAFTHVGEIARAADGQLVFFERGESAFVQAIGDNVRPLTPPTDLTFSRINETDLTLSWTDNSDNESGFLIEFRANLDSVVHRGEVIANRTTAVIRGLTPGHWSFRVRSTRLDLQSAQSNVTLVRIGSARGAPIITEILDGRRDTLLVSWADNSANEKYFGVALTEAISGKPLGGSAFFNQTTATVSEVKSGTLYWVSVWAVLSDGFVAHAEDVLFRTAPGRSRPLRPPG